MTSAEKSVSKPPNMKIFWGTIPPYPPTRLVPSALTIISPPPPPPHYLSTALQWDFRESTAEELLLEWSYGRISST